MPKIENVSLVIKDEGKPDVRHVTVSYDLTWWWREKKAGSSFIERVYLFSDEGDNLQRLRVRTLRADNVPDGVRTIESDVLTSILNEDPDTAETLVRDEVFARVSLAPFVPRSAESDSEIFKGWFT